MEDLERKIGMPNGEISIIPIACSLIAFPFSGWGWQSLLEQCGVIRRPMGFDPGAAMGDPEGQP